MPNPFAPQNKVFKPYPCREDYIIEYVRYDKLTKVNKDDPTDFIVDEQVKEKQRIKREDYIESFREDVGIENILKKVAMSGDWSIINQRKRTGLPIDPETGKEAIQDLTPFYDGGVQAAEIGDLAQKIYKSLPSALIGGRSFEKFCEEVTQEEMLAFYQGLNAGGNNDGK